MDTKCEEGLKCSIGRYSENTAQAVLSDEQIQEESFEGKFVPMVSLTSLLQHHSGILMMGVFT